MVVMRYIFESDKCLGELKGVLIYRRTLPRATFTAVWFRAFGMMTIMNIEALRPCKQRSAANSRMRPLSVSLKGRIRDYLEAEHGLKFYKKNLRLTQNGKHVPYKDWVYSIDSKEPLVVHFN